MKVGIISQKWWFSSPGEGGFSGFKICRFKELVWSTFSNTGWAHFAFPGCRSSSLVNASSDATDSY